jgi:hypothetical protein
MHLWRRENGWRLEFGRWEASLFASLTICFGLSNKNESFEACNMYELQVCCIKILVGRLERISPLCQQYNYIETHKTTNTHTRTHKNIYIHLYVYKSRAFMLVMVYEGLGKLTGKP